MTGMCDMTHATIPPALRTADAKPTTSGHDLPDDPFRSAARMVQGPIVVEAFSSDHDFALGRETQVLRQVNLLPPASVARPPLVRVTLAWAPSASSSRMLPSVTR